MALSKAFIIKRCNKVELETGGIFHSTTIKHTEGGSSAAHTLSKALSRFHSLQKGPNVTLATPQWC